MSELEQDLIIQVQFIDPIEKIINGLENREYRDCDIKWLNEKLQGYTKLCMQLLGIKGLTGEAIRPDATMNPYVTSRYVKWFTTLLNFFKGLE